MRKSLRRNDGFNPKNQLLKVFSKPNGPKTTNKMYADCGPAAGKKKSLGGYFWRGLLEGLFFVYVRTV